jgi:AcrR family transcriptional regulator
MFQLISFAMPATADYAGMMTVPKAAPAADLAKVPRTERGRRTRRRLLDAAAGEFGDKGFHEASISGITARAGVALGSFYTYFDSKDEVFRALVSDLSSRVAQEARQAITPGLTPLEIERAALFAFLAFAREHKEIYRIIDESEFVDPAAFRRHYETTAERILSRLRAGAEDGALRDDLGEAHAWAIMGMNVFLGLRFAVWSDALVPDEVADAAQSILSRGIVARKVEG